MIFEEKHQGKWVVEKNDKIIAVASSLNKLIKKVEKKEDMKTLTFSLVPRGNIIC